MFLTCGCMLLGIPLLGSGFGSGNSYYEVTLAGKVVGSVRNPDVVENAFLQADPGFPGRRKAWCWRMWNMSWTRYRRSSVPPWIRIP
ncbi:MAG: hypothetical protein V8Q27_09460 [Eubacteriales bacterium]